MIKFIYLFFFLGQKKKSVKSQGNDIVWHCHLKEMGSVTGVKKQWTNRKGSQVKWLEGSNITDNNVSRRKEKKKICFQFSLLFFSDAQKNGIYYMYNIFIGYVDFWMVEKQLMSFTLCSEHATAVDHKCKTVLGEMRIPHDD